MERHKHALEADLHASRLKMSDIRSRLELIAKCDAHLLHTQNEIHKVALTFIETIRHKEQNLLNELAELYGSELAEYLKKKDELETFVDQLKSTCNLTEMVVKGKDIEMLLLKKQLCDKFNEFHDIQLDEMPKNIAKKVGDSLQM